MRSEYAHSLPFWRIVVGVLLGLLAATVFAHESLDVNIAALTGQIAATPADAALYLQRGELYRLHEDWDAAEADFRRAAALNADDTALEFRLGRVFYESGRDELARTALLRFVAENPDHHLAQITLARTLARRGDLSAAAAAYASGLVARFTPELILERARVLERAGQPQAALQSLDEALAQRGPLIVLELETIDLELDIGRVDAALERLDRIVERMPRKERWLARRGHILEGAQRPDAARQAYAGALASIEALPASRRATRSVQELEAEVGAALERLSKLTSIGAIAR